MLVKIENLLCAALRGEQPAWPSGRDESFTGHFLERANFHGILPLLHHGLASQSALERGWLQEILNVCRQYAIAQTMWELRHQQLLTQVISSLNASGVQPVLFKGTALAYGLYDSPALRTRGDTDFLIPGEACNNVAERLETLGFVQGASVAGRYVSYQTSFTYSDLVTGDHSLDVHWRINNSQVLARLFTYDELLATAEPLMRLSPQAIAVCPEHAMLLACMHRATHRNNPYYVDGVAHYDSDRLIWLYDIHLLAEKLDAAGLASLLNAARQKGLSVEVLESLRLARQYFGTSTPENILEAFPKTRRRELASSYLSGSTIKQHWMDWMAIETARGKLAFLIEHVFPPADYMRQKYPNARAWSLPWLYVRRAFPGVLKRLNRQHETH